MAEKQTLYPESAMENNTVKSCGSGIEKSGYGNRFENRRYY